MSSESSGIARFNDRFVRARGQNCANLRLYPGCASTKETRNDGSRSLPCAALEALECPAAERITRPLRNGVVWDGRVAQRHVERACAHRARTSRVSPMSVAKALQFRARRVHCPLVCRPNMTVSLPARLQTMQSARPCTNPRRATPTYVSLAAQARIVRM